MRILRRLAVTLALGLAVCGGASADASQYADLGSGKLPAIPAYNDPAFVAAALNAHNVERRLVGVPDLIWSPELAAEAAAWVNQLARGGKMAHDSQRTHGENLWMNTAGHRSIGSMIGGWSIERNIYIIGAMHPYESTTGNWHDVGHYTQIVWADTTKVGCAVARGIQKDFLVCRYDPIGNWRGQVAYRPRFSAPPALAVSNGERRPEMATLSGGGGTAQAAVNAMASAAR